MSSSVIILSLKLGSKQAVLMTSKSVLINPASKKRNWRSLRQKRGSLFFGILKFTTTSKNKIGYVQLTTMNPKDLTARVGNYLNDLY